MCNCLDNEDTFNTFMLGFEAVGLKPARSHAFGGGVALEVNNNPHFEGVNKGSGVCNYQSGVSAGVKEGTGKYNYQPGVLPANVEHFHGSATEQVQNLTPTRISKLSKVVASSLRNPTLPTGEGMRDKFLFTNHYSRFTKEILINHLVTKKLKRTVNPPHPSPLPVGAREMLERRCA